MESSDDEEGPIDLDDRSEDDRQGGSAMDGADLDDEQAVLEPGDVGEDLDDLDGRPALAELNAIDDTESARMQPAQLTQQQPKKRGRGKAKRKYDSSALAASPKAATMSIEDGTCPKLGYKLIIDGALSYGQSCPVQSEGDGA